MHEICNRPESKTETGHACGTARVGQLDNAPTPLQVPSSEAAERGGTGAPGTNQRKSDLAAQRAFRKLRSPALVKWVSQMSRRSAWASNKWALPPTPAGLQTPTVQLGGPRGPGTAASPIREPNVQRRNNHKTLEKEPLGAKPTKGSRLSTSCQCVTKPQAEPQSSQNPWQNETESRATEGQNLSQPASPKQARSPKSKVKDWLKRPSTKQSQSAAQTPRKHQAKSKSQVQCTKTMRQALHNGSRHNAPKRKTRKRKTSNLASKPNWPPSREPQATWPHHHSVRCLFSRRRSMSAICLENMELICMDWESNCVETWCWNCEICARVWTLWSWNCCSNCDCRVVMVANCDSRAWRRASVPCWNWSNRCSVSSVSMLVDLSLSNRVFSRRASTSFSCMTASAATGRLTGSLETVDCQGSLCNQGSTEGDDAHKLTVLAEATTGPVLDGTRKMFETTKQWSCHKIYFGCVFTLLSSTLVEMGHVQIVDALYVLSLLVDGNISRSFILLLVQTATFMGIGNGSYPHGSYSRTYADRSSVSKLLPTADRKPPVDHFPKKQIWFSTVRAYWRTFIPH